MLTEINGNIDATYPIITGELTGYLGPIGTVTASADNSVGTPHVIVTQTPTPDGLDIDFAFKEMGIPGLDLTVEQDLTEEQQQTARENIDAQETLTFDNIPTSGSSNPVTSAGIYAADEDLKDYVDDSINRSSAFFRGNFATYAALMAVPWQTTDPDAPNFVSNNDYAAVADDETHSHESWRYIYVLEEGGQDNGWTAQYRINESPFTVEQLAAINSGITANDVTKLAGIEQGAQVNIVTGVKGDAEANYRTGNINITKANIGLGNVDNTSDANKPVSTAQQAAIDAATKALYDVKSAGPAAIVSIHDAEAIPVKSLVAQIAPLQDLHGQSAPYPAGGGKNLLNLELFNDAEYFTINDDGTITQLKSDNRNESNMQTLHLVAGTYTFTTYPVSGRHTIYYRENDSWVNIVYNSTTLSNTFTLAEDHDVYFKVSTGGSSYPVTLKVALFSGSEALPWEPYSNICPISGWTGANIADAENYANLRSDAPNTTSDKSVTFDVTRYPFIRINGTATGGSAYSGAIGATTSSFRLPAGTYTLKLVGTVSNANVTLQFEVGSGLSNVVLNKDNLSYTFTLAQTYGVGWYASVASGLACNATFSIVYSKGSVLNIDWTDEAGTVYKGNLNATTGLLTDEFSQKATFTGMENWLLDTQYHSRYSAFYLAQNNLARMDDYRGSIIASNMMTIERAGLAFDSQVNTIAISGYSNNPSSPTNYLYIIVDNQAAGYEGITTAAALKTWLGNNNVEVTFKAQTPQTYQLTPTEVKTLLGDNNIFVDTGDVQVTYETGTVAVALADLYEKLAAQIGA